CVLKADSGRTLGKAVRTVLEGQEFVSERLRAAYDARRHLEKGQLQTHLTGREREVLQLLTEGRGNKEIAELLGISPKTAETHRARMMTKLGLHSMSELVRYAVRNRIIEPRKRSFGTYPKHAARVRQTTNLQRFQARALQSRRYCGSVSSVFILDAKR